MQNLKHSKRRIFPSETFRGLKEKNLFSPLLLRQASRQLEGPERIERAQDGEPGRTICYRGGIGEGKLHTDRDKKVERI